MLRLVFLAALIGLGASCPDGYSDDGEGNCISTPLNGTRIAAYSRCSQDGGNLFEVANVFTNIRIQEYADGADKIWLGLTCTSNEKTSCRWDSGVNLTYSNFRQGYPKATMGTCVAMSVLTGEWMSVDCSQTVATFGCEITPGIEVPGCAPGSNYFNGYCYWGIVADSFSSASTACSEQCGAFASIHSDGENSFVRDIGLSVSNDAIYLYTGLTYSDGRYNWNDGSAYDYNHFVYQNLNLGKCVGMSREKNPFDIGSWVNVPCEGSLVAVCEKNLTNSCDIPATQTPPLAPFQCNQTYFYSGSGQMYSPGYPYASQPNHCDYLITEEEGLQPTISFEDLALDSSSTIRLYRSLFDRDPFVTLTGVVSSGGKNSYTSSTNILKISYDTSGSDSFNNFWEANYFVSQEEETTAGQEPTTAKSTAATTTTSTTTTTTTSTTTTTMICTVNEDYYGNGNQFVYPYTCGSISFHSDGFGPSYGRRCVRFGNYQGAQRFDLYRSDSVYFARLQYIGRYGDITDISKLIFCPGISNLVKLDYYSTNSIAQIFYGVSPSYSNSQLIAGVQEDAIATTEKSTGRPEGTYPYPNCNFEYFNNGNITSPGYPGNYSDNLNCTYKLIGGANSYVVLRFDDFDLEANYDRVTIYDGEVEDGVVLGFWLTGTADPAMVDGYYAFSGQMTLVFTTDNDVVRTGFSAHFASYPRGE